MKKLLLVNNSLSNGGSERVLTILANEFVKRGYDVDMLLYATLENETYFVDSRVKLIRYNSDNLHGFPILWNWFKLIRQTLKHERYYRVISFLKPNNVVTLLAAKRTGNSVIVSERNNPFANFKVFDVFRIGEQLLYPSAHAVVFQTDEVQKKYKDSIRKISYVIPNPVNPELGSISSFCEHSEKYILAAGRLHKQKNYPMLINAFRNFVEEYPEYKLRICGKGELEKELKDLVKNLGITEKVEFVGFVNNIDKLMQKATMFVISSDYEGISNSMIEALAIGVPTIATDCPVGGARMMIKSGENGLLVPVGDVDALTEAMKYIASDNLRAFNMGIEAQKIREQYCITNIVNMWEKVLRGEK